MAQEYIKIRKSASDEWLVLPQPDSGALSYDFETTYTEDSGRTQTGAEIYTLSLHDALPISMARGVRRGFTSARGSLTLAG